MRRCCCMMRSLVSLNFILVIMLSSCSKRGYEISDEDIQHIKTMLSDTSSPELAELQFLKSSDSSNFLLSDVGPCWSELVDGRKMLCGYYNEGFSTKLSGYRSGFENWFIASSANNELINRWFNKFKAFWDHHSNPKDVRTAQEFK